MTYGKNAMIYVHTINALNHVDTTQQLQKFCTNIKVNKYAIMLNRIRNREKNLWVVVQVWKMCKPLLSSCQSSTQPQFEDSKQS